MSRFYNKTTIIRTTSTEGALHITYLLTYTPYSSPVSIFHCIFTGKTKARFPFKRNRLRCVRCVNENRKKRKRLRFLRFSFTIAFEWKPGFTPTTGSPSIWQSCTAASSRNETVPRGCLVATGYFVTLWHWRLTFWRTHWWADIAMDCLCTKFGYFGFCRFEFIVRTDRQTDRQTESQMRMISILRRLLWAWVVIGTLTLSIGGLLHLVQNSGRDTAQSQPQCPLRPRASTRSVWTGLHCTIRSNQPILMDSVNSFIYLLYGTNGPGN